MDAIAGYCAASEANDIDALVETLAPDVSLVSPLSGRLIFQGRADLQILARAVYGTITGVRWEPPIGEGREGMAIARARIGPLRVDDAMVFELASDGRISRIRPHLRPWLATTLFALVVAPKMLVHPGVMWRAIRAGFAA